MARLARRTIDLIRALTSVAFTAGVLVGVPVALVTMIGRPLPTTAPSLDLARRHIEDGDIPTVFILKFLAAITWIIWAQLTLTFLIEVAARIAGRNAARAPVLPGIQLAAAKLATSVTLIIAALQPARTAAATPLTPLATATTPAELHADPLEPLSQARPLMITDDGQVVEEPTVADEPYVTQPGDSWWRIAEQLLGDGIRWSEIRDLNLDRTMPDGVTITTTTEIIQPGWPLHVPPGARLPLPSTTTGNGDGDEPPPTVTIEPGDDLWTLAHTQLADTWDREPTDTELTAYWADVVAANADRLASGDPDLIYPDEEVVLPAPPSLATSPPPATADEYDRSAGSDEDLDPAGIEREPGTGPDTPAASSTTEPAPTTADVNTTSTSAISTTGDGQRPGERDSVEQPPPPTRSAGDPAAGDHQTVVDGVAVIGTGIFGTAIGGGALLVLLRRRRHRQARRRRPGTPVTPNPTDQAAFEARIRPIADTHTTRWLLAINHYLSHQLEQHPDNPLPALVGMRANDRGIEIVLQAPCPPLDGFTAADDDHNIWRIDPNLDLPTIEAGVKETIAYSPALLPAGETADGNLLLDFEALGAIAVSGDPTTIAGWLRSLALAGAAAPWTEHCEIIAVGIDDALADLPNVVIPTDPDTWADRTIGAMTLTAADLPGGTHALRAGRDRSGEIHYPTVALIGSDHGDIAERLSEIATDPRAPLALITSAPLTIGITIAIEPGHATIERFDLEFIPTSSSSDTIQRAADLLTATSANPEDRHEPAENPVPPAAISIPDPDTTRPTRATNGATTAGAHSKTSVGRHDGDASPSIPGPHGAPDPVPDDIEEAVNQVLAPQPIEVQVLRALPTVTGLCRAIPPKPEAVIVYLTVRGPASSGRLRQEFWPHSVTRATFDNAMTKIRRALGTNPHTDQPRLVYDRRTQHYHLSAEVGSDWGRAEQLLNLADTATTAAGEIACLQAALTLIESRPGDDAISPTYNWLRDDYDTYSRIETALIDAASRLGELALAVGDTVLARWAANQGLTVVPAHEALYRLLMRAAHQAGDRHGIESAYDNAVRAAETYDPLEEIQDETAHLYHQLTDRRRRHR